MPNMTKVARLLENNLLEADAAGVFHDGHRRVSQRQAHWRDNFPAVGLLLDTDEERAQALAGNFATEAREIVGVWLSAQESPEPDESGTEARVAWIEDFWAASRAAVFERPEVGALEGAPRQRFAQIFDQLEERFRADAVAFVRHGGRRDEVPTRVARLTAPLRALARGIEGFFFPSVRQ